MRLLVVAILVVLLVAGGLFAFGVLPPGEKEPERPDLFVILEQNDPAAVLQALAEGADLHGRNEAGLTPLMTAISSGASTAVIGTLLEAGANINEQAASGTTALMLAAGMGTPAQVIYLLNAGADPTPKDTQGRNAAELAMTNSRVRTSGVYPRLIDLADRPFVQGWPTGYVVPVEGATISSRRSHLPGAPRTYRNGVHEGFDFYAGTVSVPINYGTPINAVADGVVIRADTEYVELSLAEYQALIDQAGRSLDTPPDILDALRGRQVWIRHAGGFVTRYAHLAAVAENVIVGATVAQGDIIGTTGNSGTLEAAQGTQDDPHPHVEVWRGDSTFLGAGLEPEQIWELAGQVFGQAALPPFHD
ncbi:MAG: peptidoglycan DD-metalloendopeptidase family protein [Trueperaceae bacterium]